MIVPTVNINGTDGNVLLAHYTDAMKLAQGLQDKLREIFPHGRDYQLAPETYPQARKEHERLIENVQQVYEELLVIALDINKQLGK